MKLNVAELLTITTGRLYTKDLMSGVYRVLNELLNENLMTHHLPVAMDFCKPQIIKQVSPELNIIIENWVYDNNWQNKINDLQNIFGDVDITVDKTGFEEYMINNSLLLKRVNNV